MKFLLIALALLALTGCYQFAELPGDVAVKAVPAGAWTVTPRVLREGAYGGRAEPLAQAATNAAEYAALTEPVGEAPKVDFEKETAIGVFLGQRLGGGYSVRVDVQEEPDAVRVRIVETKPAPGTMQTRNITFPFVLVAVPVKGKPVRFE